MIIPEFMRYYRYSLEQVLNMYAVTFDALANSMYQLMAKENINAMQVQLAARSDEAGRQMYLDMQQQAYDGVDKLVEQAKLLRGIKHGK